MSSTVISTVSTVGISLSATGTYSALIEPTGALSITSGLYAVAGNNAGASGPAYLQVTNDGGVINDTALNSFGVTLAGGGKVTNSGTTVTVPLGFNLYRPTISGNAAGIAISGESGTVINSGTIEATATSGVGVDLYAGGSVTNAVNLIRGGPEPVYTVGVITGGASAAAVHIAGGTGVVTNVGGTIGAGSAGVGIYLGAGGTVSNQEVLTLTRKGTISATQYGILAKGGATTITNYGTISGGTAAVSLPAGYANLLREFPGAALIGAVNGGNTIGAAVGSMLELEAGASTLSGLGGSITNFTTIFFDHGSDWFLSGDTAGIAGGQAFQNFGSGDTINITGVTNETIAGFNANTLTLTGSSALDIVFTGEAATEADFHVSNDITNGTDITTDLPGDECFAAGTRILTDRGEIAVEQLREGDRVVTLPGDGTAPVVWIGRRHVRPRQHPRPETVQPVVVQPGAFGPRLPHRTLRLSPDHAVFLDGALIPIGLLINGDSIVQEDVAEVTYYHVELPEHEVLYAEGMTCESYLATGDMTAFDNNVRVVALHPKFSAAAIWETKGCAPLIKRGTRLNAIRERLARSRPAASRVA